MRTNYKVIFDAEINYLFDMFKTNNWSRLFENTFTKQMPDGKEIKLFLYHDLLQYTELGNKVITPWVACQVTVNLFETSNENPPYDARNNNLIKSICEFLDLELSIIGINPFTDDLAMHTHFKIVPDIGSEMGDFTFHIIFYTNPNYQNGFKQNGIL